MEVINHFRDRDVPEQIERLRLTQIGVSDGLLNRVWSTLQYLGLIREDGTTTEAFQGLRYASEGDYPKVFQGILNDVYADIFGVLNPAEADEGALERAFRPYSPGGQRERMITLFLGLCREAGIDTKVQRNERSAQVATGGKKQTKAPVAVAGARKKISFGSETSPPPLAARPRII